MAVEGSRCCCSDCYRGRNAAANVWQNCNLSPDSTACQAHNGGPLTAGTILCDTGKGNLQRRPSLYPARHWHMYLLLSLRGSHLLLCNCLPAVTCTKCLHVNSHGSLALRPAAARCWQNADCCRGDPCQAACLEGGSQGSAVHGTHKPTRGTGEQQLA